MDGEDGGRAPQLRSAGGERDQQCGVPVMRVHDIGWLRVTFGQIGRHGAGEERVALGVVRVAIHLLPSYAGAPNKDRSHAAP